MGFRIGIGMAIPRGEGVGEFTPLALGSKLLLWLDADRDDLITEAAGAVSSWLDIKNAYNFAQAGAGKPTYSATSFNGAPGISSDGTDDELTLASQPLPSGAGDFEVFALCQQDALAADATIRRLFGWGANSSGTSFGIQRNVVGGVNRAQLSVGNGSAILVTDANVDFSSRHLIHAKVTPTETTLTVDNEHVTGPTAIVPAIGSIRARVFASTANTPAIFWQGVGAAIAVTAPLTTEEREKMTAFFLTRSTEQGPNLMWDDGDQMMWDDGNRMTWDT